MDASIRDNFVVGHIHAQDHEGTFHIECTPTQPQSNNEHFFTTVFKPFPSPVNLQLAHNNQFNGYKLFWQVQTNPLSFKYLTVSRKFNKKKIL